MSKELIKKYDVVVVGGGISGCMAAIAAARAGSAVLLVEKYGFLGGTLTACGTGPMMTFHAGDKLVVRGICNELIERLKKKGLSTGHIFDTIRYTYTVTPFDAEGMKRELEEMCIEAGVTLLYHTYATDAV
ncbi:MAG: FAD-dependent oxidoreductase [Lachnospiraceae bacterium]|nr:FAD-dependent oxidoreductase [Lachnospiraceae bacterium]